MLFTIFIFLNIQPEVLNLLRYRVSLNLNKQIVTRGDHIWTANGPYGGYINDIACDSNYVYIAPLMNGVYRYESGGWTPRRAGIEYATVLSILGFGRDTIFAGIDRGGLWQTIDGGLNWVQNNTIPDTISVNTITRYSTNTLFAGTEYRGIFRSLNGGLIWSKVGGLLGDTVNTKTFARDTLNLYLGTSGNGIYISGDLGNIWNTLPSPDNFVNKLGFYTRGLARFLYAGCDNGLYYRLLGVWHATNLFTEIADFVLKGESLFVATAWGGVFVGRLGDSLFFPRNNGLIYNFLNSIEITGDTLLAGAWGGFFYSADNGQNWHERNDNLNTSVIFDIEVNPQNRHSIYSISFGGLYKSSDNGDSWQRWGAIPDLLFLTTLAINPQDTNIIFIGSYFGIHRSLNGGMSWQFLPIGARIVTDIEIDRTNPSRLYATTDSFFFKSINNGDNWIPSDTGLYYNDVVICSQATETLYVATYQGVYKSINFGEDFFPMNTGLPGDPINKVNMDGLFPWFVYAGLKSIQIGLPSIYRSTDGGFNWSPTGFPENSVMGLKTLKDVPFYLLASSAESKVHISLDGGNSWLNISPNLPGNLSFSLGINPELHTAFLGNLSGVYSYTDTTKPIISVSAPDSFSPDGDSIEDRIKFNITASDSHGIFYWRISIHRDTIVCLDFEGFGILDSVFWWNGFNSAGILQRNGIYECRVRAIDGFFNIDSTIKVFRLNKKPLVSGVNWATSFPQGRKVAFDNTGRIHVVYTTFRLEEVFYTNSTDGINWTEPIDLSNTRNSFSTNPCIVIDANNTIYVFWEEQVADSHDIVYRQYIMGNWQTIRKVTQTPDPSMNPSITVTLNNDLHLVWQEASPNNDVFYRRYNAFNGQWDPQFNVSQTLGISRDPFIIAENGLYVFFSDNTSPPNFEIRYRHWDGSVWRPESSLTSTSSNSYLSSAISDSFGQIHLFWVDSTPGNFDIYYKKFTPGLGWSQDTNLTQTIAKSHYPTASVDSLNNIYVFWYESGDIYRKIKDHQLGWLDSFNISNTLAGSRFPSSSIGCNLVWTEGDFAPYSIIHHKEIISSPDSIPPRFTISAPDTCYIADTLLIHFAANETLDTLPYVTLKDTLGDTLQFTVFEDSNLYYAARVFVAELEKGRGGFTISGRDLAGNPADTTQTIWIGTKGRLLAKDFCFAFPNPTKKDYIKFTFLLNQNAHLKIEIFTLSGRKIHTFIDSDYMGGKIYVQQMSVKNLGSDIYIFKATATVGNEKETVMKKFGVIR